MVYNYSTLSCVINRSHDGEHLNTYWSNYFLHNLRHNTMKTNNNYYCLFTIKTLRLIINYETQWLLTIFFTHVAYIVALTHKE